MKLTVSERVQALWGSNDGEAPATLYVLHHLQLALLTHAGGVAKSTQSHDSHVRKVGPPIVTQFNGILVKQLTDACYLRGPPQWQASVH